MVDKEKGILVDNKTRTVRIMDDKILFTLKCDGITDYYSNHPELAKILVMDCIHPYHIEGRLKFKIVEKGKELLTCHAHQVALGCYMGRVRSDTFITDIAKLKRECLSNSITVDHADSVLENNTVYNLSFMTASENARKGAIVSRFRDPVRITVAYFKNEYRIFVCNPIIKPVGLMEEFITQTSIKRKMWGGMWRICDTAADFCECLEWLSQNVIEGSVPMRTENGKWLRQDQPAFYMNAEHSMIGQRLLTMMDRNIFEPFKIQQKKEALIF